MIAGISIISNPKRKLKPQAPFRCKWGSYFGDVLLKYDERGMQDAFAESLAFFNRCFSTNHATEPKHVSLAQLNVTFIIFLLSV